MFINYGQCKDLQTFYIVFYTPLFTQKKECRQSYKKSLLFFADLLSLKTL